MSDKNHFRYRVRQTFWSLGDDCEEIFKTRAEAEEYGRRIATGLAGIFYQRAGEYANVPHRKLVRRNPGREAASPRGSETPGDIDAGSLRFQVRGKMTWSELVDRIYRLAVEIEPIK
ncbi:MAG: hypothetical protein WBX20_01695 [Terrimicrobiaceae bacterium]